MEEAGTPLPDETLESIRQNRRRAQGPDHDADRNRFSLGERRAPPRAPALRLRPALQDVPGRPLALRRRSTSWSSARTPRTCTRASSTRREATTAEQVIATLNGLQQKQIAPGLGHLGEADQRGGIAPDHPLRLRLRARQRPPRGRGHHEGEHHEVHGRALPLDLPRGRGRLPGDRVARGARGRALHGARPAPGGVRRARPAESVRRHRQRHHGRARRRPRPRARSEHRDGGSGVRGHPRLGAALQRTEQGQSDGDDPLRAS